MALDDLSCAGPASCVVIAGAPVERVALGWDGSRWARLAPPLPIPADLIFPTSSRLSCATPTSCVLVSFSIRPDSPVSTTQLWNGTSWSAQPKPFSDGPGSLRDLDCPAADLCVAAGSIIDPPGSSTTVDVGLTWNGTTWTRQPLPTGGLRLVVTTLSCSTADRCLGVAGGYAVDHLYPAVYGVAGGRRGWIFTQLPILDPQLSTTVAARGVSCAGDWCMVVGDTLKGADLKPLALRYRLP
jgi:hypothetical protein